MGKETFSFQAEVSKLLDIVAHSLYSHKEIFLRELISNASDACDKLRYEALTKPHLTSDDSEFKITLDADKKAKTLCVTDNGIGMNRDDLMETLGTIARSGTQAFMDALSAAKKTEKKVKGDKNSDARVDLIGQFGVGFYSAFMVADKIEVTTRRAGESRAWLWVSDGRGEFSIEETSRESHGTDVTVHIKKEDKEYLDRVRIQTIVKTYSDHVGLPVILKGDGKKQEDETLNTAAAVWTRQKRDITAENYKDFYQHVSHMYDEPWLIVHNRVEGVQAYTNLLFIPSSRPFDLFQPERKSQLKLYVKRVFITDNCDELLPSYFRFVRGIVDSEDLPLNISRELLQHNPQLAKIKKALTKRLFSELKKKAEKTPEEYATFWKNFGAVMKEGLYEDFENRKALLDISRFRSTKSDGLISLNDYIAGMRDGQEAIYYITGEDAAQTTLSPQLEGFKAKAVEVLLLTDPVDEFWVSSVGSFEEKVFKSATRGGADLKDVKSENDKLDQLEGDRKKKVASVEPLIAAFKIALGEKVKDIRTSERLTDSAVCLVADDGDMDIHLERLLKQHKQLNEETPRVLELNADHSLITKLAARVTSGDGKDPIIDDAAHLLLDQARIIEGENLSDPSAFSRRLSSVMEKGFSN
ncbi:MAG: molecular chaperone HtpG [Rhodospirillaceae bacterium TMED8]|nr:molecular chaperone HtpG [Magnetovibrio sp.]OUT52172.1 MAG: molecular chaperone HtpG [Rhodospirillaceae bacterium TMED8]|tara:strand:+ start:2304 stop:4226 length:1923 start_codon:yes stop_codon:yes gene_type:complete